MRLRRKSGRLRDGLAGGPPMEMSYRMGLCFECLADIAKALSPLNMGALVAWTSIRQAAVVRGAAEVGQSRRLGGDEFRFAVQVVVPLRIMSPRQSPWLRV